ncbi:MAG: ATP-binding protein [Bacteroidia bacterium]|nr:ATP-binding protein [Bacteroidia bacterium]
MLIRDIYLKKIVAGFKIVQIVVLIGARQVGKTSIMKSCKWDRKDLFLNGQDPEIAELFQRLSDIEQYLRVYLDEKLDGYLLLDEFQYIDGISTMLKLLTDKHPQLKILCSGSSSLDILQQIEESLAGRVRTIEVLSLSFDEYLLFRDGSLHKLYQSFGSDTETSALTASIEEALSEYLLYGGLPRTALTINPDEKIEILDDIYKTYLLRDVRSYVANQDFVGFNKLLRLLASQIGNLVNINEISRQTGLTYKKCEEYLFLLEQMYIIKMIELGLRNILDGNFKELTFRNDNGPIFENFVMLELWRNKKPGGTLQFYRTTDGTEVDFVMNQLKEVLAIECKYKNLRKPMSIASLNNFCKAESIENKFIVNRNLNTTFNQTKFIQGFLANRVGN